MDRRQKRTREAIFNAFTLLLSERNYNQLSVQEIIDKANIGRTTFYSHFETKESLLEDLCTELFGHIIDTAKGIPHGHYNFSCGTSNDSVFLHLLRHLQENDYNILQLLSSQNNEIFLQYFKSNLQHLIQIQYAEKGLLKKSTLPLLIKSLLDTSTASICVLFIFFEDVFGNSVSLKMTSLICL